MPKQKKTADKNLALIALILGAASFTNTIFTGIPAIVLGIVALKRKSGSQNQAKIAIVLGIIGSLLIIPIIMVAVYFLRQPFSEQFSVPQTESSSIRAIVDKLNEYKKQTGNYPNCNEGDTERSCTEWRVFTDKNPGLVTYPVEFESQSYSVEDRAVGTIVYAQNTTCFVNTPTDPRYLEDSTTRHLIDSKDYAAIIYYHSRGRACFPTNTN